MPRRTIYSADQASPSTYDTTFADFLDRIPQLIGGFQENQIKLGRQQLEDRRYEDEKEFRQDKYEDTLAQRKIENARQRKEFEARQAEGKRRKAEADRKHDLEEDKLIITATTPGYQRDQVMEKLGYITNETAGKNTDYRNNLRDDLDALYNIDNPWAREDKLKEITSDENYRNIFGESEFTKAINDARKNTRDYVRSHPDGLIPSDRWASVDAYEGKMDSEEEGRLLTDLKTLSKQRVEQEASGLGTVDIDNAIEARKSELDNLRQKYSYGSEEQYAHSKAPGVLLPPGEAQKGFYSGDYFAGYQPFNPNDPEEVDKINNEVIENLNKLTGEGESITESPQDSTVTTPTSPLMSKIPTVQAKPTQTPPPETGEKLKLGSGISGDLSGEQIQYNVGDVTKEKGIKKNPQVARRFAKDFSKLNSLMSELKNIESTNVRQREDHGWTNPKYRKKQLSKSANKILKELQGHYGSFINPGTGEFSDKKFNDQFYSVLSRHSDLSKDQLRNILKRVSTVKTAKTLI